MRCDISGFNVPRIAQVGRRRILSRTRVLDLLRRVLDSREYAVYAAAVRHVARRTDANRTISTTVRAKLSAAVDRGRFLPFLGGGAQRASTRS